MRLINSITQRILWVITFLGMRIFCKFYITGKNNLKGFSTPLLVVANHRSYWDSMILGTIFPFFSKKYFPIGFMAADNFFEKPLYKFILNLCGVCPANKGKGLDISLKKFRSILSNNGIVIIFPYGKRVYNDFEQPSPGRGAPTLIQEFKNLTVLPVYLQTTSGLSLKEFLFGKKEMSVMIGEPYKIDAQNKTLNEISDILTRSFLKLNKKYVPEVVQLEPNCLTSVE